MTVYVDNPRNKLGRMKMCHMLADSTEELISMVDKINVNKKWIQNSGNPNEHFDICLFKRDLAIKNGAQEVSSRRLVTLIRSKRTQMPILIKHTFKVWHPKDGQPAVFEDAEFTFNQPVSRTQARTGVMNEGFEIASIGKKRGPKATTARRQKIKTAKVKK